MERTTTERTMFSLLKVSLFKDEPVQIEDWQSVFAEMEKQAVAGLPSEWLRKHPIANASAWERYCLLQQGRWIKVMHGQSQMLELLKEYDIPCVIIKGSAAAMAYPYPRLRTMGDVDFLVKRVDFERASALLKENEYRLTYEEERNPAVHHEGYSKDGVRFELHWRLRVIEESDEELLSMYEQGIDNREFRTLGDYEFPVFGTVLNGTVLLLHIYQHLSRTGLGLRQIIDWMVYVDSLPEGVWADELLPMLKRMGVERLALTVTATCQKYFGLRELVEDTSRYPCDELMACIMDRGNFGCKAGSAGKAVRFTTSSSRFGIFWRLQKGGMIEWPAAQKYPVLRPFAWFYQLFRIPRIMITKRMSPKAIIRQVKSGKSQISLLKSLGLEAEGTIHT